VLLLAALATAATAAPVESGKGERLYRTQCAPCHGEGGRGDGPDAALFSAKPRDLGGDFLARYTTGDLVRRVREGRALQLIFHLPSLQARAKEVESLVVHLQRLPEVDWRAVEDGEWIYTQRCEDCHGRYGEARRSPPPGVRPPRNLGDPAFQRSTDDAALLLSARHGRDGMPGLVPRLSDEEARVVTRYVRLLSDGYRTYTQYCAHCHGADGRGVGSFAEAERLPTTIFDRAYFRRTDPERVRAKVWHMLDEHQPSMPHFAETLDEEEVRSIIEVLRRLGSPVPTRPAG
jgi:mono/diheme cytochrome c family protein